MGKSSGGTRSSAPTAASALSEVLAKVENEIRNNKYETTVILNDDGSVAFRKEGTRMGVTYEGRLGTNKVVTHNHPGVDAPFSSSDLRDAVKFNEKEIRAVSRNFTFSMKRPKEGWGDVKPDAIMRTYSTIKRQVAKEWESKFKKVRSGAPMRKEYFNSQIEVQKRIAKKYGWEFSYKKDT